MTPVQVQLLNMILMLLTTMVGSAAFGAYLFRNVLSWVFPLITFVVAIVIIVISTSVSTALGAFTVAVMFGLTMGASLGGFITILTKDHPRGKQAVGITLGIILVILVVASIIGLFSGYDFSGLRGTMFTILVGIVILSLIGLVIQFGKFLEFVMSLGIIGFFSVYLVVHINQIKDVVEIATWSDALNIAMSIFLDLLNIFVRLLPIILDAMD